MEENQQSPPYPVGHEDYAKEHTLDHIWRMSKYYSASEGIKEMLRVEKFMHETPERANRIGALEFVTKLLDYLVDKELVETYKELRVHLKLSGLLPDDAKDQTPDQPVATEPPAGSSTPGATA